MTADTPRDLEGLPGLAAARTYAQLGRDLLALWASTGEQMIRLSVDTGETATDAVRARFGRWAVPGATDVWTWWASSAAGFLGAYAETLQKGARPAPATPESAGPTIEVDVTESATRGGRARQRVAG